jgi:mannosyltransferase OCH1-like enzyme
MFRDCHQKWIDLNDTIIIKWYSKEDCNNFMKEQMGSDILECYNALKPMAFKADLFRLCVLYLYGGVYADSHTTPYISIRDMMKGCVGDNLFISVLDNKQSGSGIHNGIIITEPKHPFIKQYIDSIVENVKNRRYTDHLLAVTGPICFSRSVNKVLGRNINTEFVKGWNRFDSLSFYLYELKWGPMQYVYKEGKVILSKKHCLLTYIMDKMKSGNYATLWRDKNIYN